MTWKRANLMFLAALVLAIAGAGGPAYAGLVVLPPGNAGAEGNAIFGMGAPITAQVVYGASTLSGLPIGSVINGFSLRLNGGLASGPAAAMTTSNFDVWIGKSNFAPGSLSTTFANNLGADTVHARSGGLTFPASSFPGGSIPNGFGPEIIFSTPYTYTGGDLLLMISYSTFNRSLTLDGQSGLAGAQEIQASSYNASTATTNVNGYGLVVELNYSPPAAVPEPATFASVLSGIALCGLATALRRRRSAA